MKIKIVSERLISPKTAFSLLSRNSLIFKIVFLNCELIKKYLRKKIEIKIDNQFNIIFIRKKSLLLDQMRRINL